MPEIKKVLHVIDTAGAGGAETVFKEIAKGVGKGSFESLALIKGDGWLKNALVKDGTSFVERNCKGSLNIGFLIYLVKLIHGNNIDVIHAHLLGSGVYACVAGFITRKPVITTLHGKVDVSEKENFLWLKLKIITVLSKYLILVSDSLKEHVNTLVKTNDRKTEVVLNGVSFPRLDNNMEKPKTHFDVYSDRIVVGALGNIRPAKNYRNFIEALALLVDKGVDVQGVIAGDGDNLLQRELEQLVKEKGLTDRCKFLGFVSDTTGYLQSLNVYVMSSLSEGLPLSLIQGMMLGLPIVVTRCGVEEFLEHEKEGLIVDNDQPQALADGIERAVTERAVSKVWGANAKVRAESSYSIEKMIARYEDLYISAMGQKQ